MMFNTVCVNLVTDHTYNVGLLGKKRTLIKKRKPNPGFFFELTLVINYPTLHNKHSIRKE